MTNQSQLAIAASTRPKPKRAHVTPADRTLASHSGQPVSPGPSNADKVLAGVQRWNSTHPSSQDIDPQAALKVADVEGLSGGIGDGGHAFGPFQLNNAGGVITGKWSGTPEQLNAQAWSPAGIDYALQGVARASGGQRGAQAVESTVRNFERPADPNGEVARALGQSGGGAASSGPSPMGAATPPGNRQAFVQALLGAISPTGQLNDPSALVGALQTRGQSPAFAPSPMVSAAAPRTGAARSLASVDGIQVDPAIAGQLESVVKQFGVTPTSGYRSADHNAAVGGAQNSDHLSGDAVDFGGTSQALAALYKYAQGRYPYVEPMAQAKNHVHISFKR